MGLDDEGSDRALNWYALRVRSRHEQAVERAVAGSGFEAFLPRFTAEHVWSDRKRLVSLPLFPGYLFARCAMDATVKSRLLASSAGIVEVVGVHGRAVRVPDGEIDSIRALLAALDRVEPLDRVVPGERMRVISGPLKGVEGVVVKRRGLRRIVCAVSLLGRAVEADFDWGEVTPVAEEK